MSRKKVPLYCICQKPWDEDGDDQMIECEMCKEWFHQSCLDMSDRDFKKAAKSQWFCNGCKEGGKGGEAEGSGEEEVEKPVKGKQKKEKSVRKKKKRESQEMGDEPPRKSRRAPPQEAIEQPEEGDGEESGEPAVVPPQAALPADAQDAEGLDADGEAHLEAALQQFLAQQPPNLSELEKNQYVNAYCTVYRQQWREHTRAARAQQQQQDALHMPMAPSSVSAGPVGVSPSDYGGNGQFVPAAASSEPVVQASHSNQGGFKQEGEGDSSTNMPGVGLGVGEGDGQRLAQDIANLLIQQFAPQMEAQLLGPLTTQLAALPFSLLQQIAQECPQDPKNLMELMQSLLKNGALMEGGGAPQQVYPDQTQAHEAMAANQGGGMGMDMGRVENSDVTPQRQESKEQAASEESGHGHGGPDVSGGGEASASGGGATSEDRVTNHEEQEKPQLYPHQFAPQHMQQMQQMGDNYQAYSAYSGFPAQDGSAQQEVPSGVYNADNTDGYRGGFTHPAQYSDVPATSVQGNG